MSTPWPGVPLRLRRWLLVLGLAVLAGACGDDLDVGDRVDTGGDLGGSLSIGEPVTTTIIPAPALPTGSVGAPGVTTPTTTPPRRATAPAPAAVRTTATSAPALAAFTIEINGDDTVRPQFDPPNADIAIGTVIRFVNNDVVTRSVIAQSGAFRSPDIRPGQSWSYHARHPGAFDYQDGTRPYAIGRFVVQ